MPLLAGKRFNQWTEIYLSVWLWRANRGHIPYRNSKLTRMLEPALGGNSRTAIICTITPAPAFREESISTLKFANRAKQIKNKPKVNEVMDQASMLKRYKQQISKLQKKLKKIESKVRFKQLLRLAAVLISEVWN